MKPNLVSFFELNFDEFWAPFWAPKWLQKETKERQKTRAKKEKKMVQKTGQISLQEPIFPDCPKTTRMLPDSVVSTKVEQS